MRCLLLIFVGSSFSFQFDSSLTFDCAFIVKEHPRLKSKYKECIQVATKYAKTIDDFDNFVDPRTLAHHFLGPDPSSFILHVIEIEEKSEFCFDFFPFFYVSPFCHAEMMNKFNQEMYAKIKAKKNDPLSSLGKKMVRVIEKGTSITPATSVPETTRIAFPMTSLEDRGRGLWQRERRKWALRRPISGTMLELPWRGPNLLLLLKTLKRFLAFLLMGL